MIKRGGKKAQMKLSFGMIFSIILIIVFLAFAFYAISKFLSISDSIKVGKFSDNLQSDIDNAWKSSQTSEEYEYSLPSKIKKVCFIDYGVGPENNEDIYDEIEVLYHGDKGENLFFYPIGSSGGLDALVIEHINLSEITRNENPFCLDVTRGELTLTLKKDYGEILVRIER